MDSFGVELYIQGRPGRFRSGWNWVCVAYNPGLNRWQDICKKNPGYTVVHFCIEFLAYDISCRPLEFDKNVRVAEEYHGRTTAARTGDPIAQHALRGRRNNTCMSQVSLMNALGSATKAPGSVISCPATASHGCEMAPPTNN